MRATAKTALRELENATLQTQAERINLCLVLRNVTRNVIVPYVKDSRPGYCPEFERLADSLDVVNPLHDWNFPDRPENLHQLIIDRIDELTMRIDRLTHRKRVASAQERRAA